MVEGLWDEVCLGVFLKEDARNSLTGSSKDQFSDDIPQGHNRLVRFKWGMSVYRKGSGGDGEHP